VSGMQVGIKLGGLRSFLTDWMAEEMLLRVRVACKDLCWCRAWVTSFGDIGLASVVTWDGMPC